jgi:hypothetical protein
VKLRMVLRVHLSICARRPLLGGGLGERLGHGTSVCALGANAQLSAVGVDLTEQQHVTIDLSHIKASTPAVSSPRGIARVQRRANQFGIG